VRFLMSVGDLVLGWLLQKQAAVAIAALDAGAGLPATSGAGAGLPATSGQGATGADKSFYEGKIAVASFFAKSFLPLLTSTRLVLDNIDNDVMDLDEAAF
jgi:hypothetical protein